MLVWNRPRRVISQEKLVANRRRQRRYGGRLRWQPRIDLTGLWIFRGPTTWR